VIYFVPEPCTYLARVHLATQERNILISNPYRNAHLQHCLCHLILENNRQEYQSMNQSKRCRRDFPHTAKRLRETCPSEIAFVGSHSLIIYPFASVLFYPLWESPKRKNCPENGTRKGSNRRAAIPPYVFPVSLAITQYFPALSFVSRRLKQS
jgi:hypothetical protein